MRRRSLVISLFGIMLIAFIALGATLVAGRSPLLGLDLEGGVSVVLQPHGHVTDSELQTAVNIIDSRVNGIGVANSTVDRQGNDVVIELPGTKNASKDIKVIGTTAQLFFRPVDCTILPYAAPTKSTTTTTNPKSSPTTTPGHTGTNSTPSTAPHSSSTTAKSSAGSPSRAALTAFVQRGSTVRSQLTGSPAPLASGATSTTTPPASSTTAPSTTAPSTTVPSTTVPPTSTSTPGTTTPTTAPASTGTKSTDRTAYLAKGCESAASASIPTTNVDDDLPDDTVVVPSSPSSGYGTTRWILGPADLPGEVVKTASAGQSQTGQNVVNVTLTNSGLADFNKIAAIRYANLNGSSTSPSPKSQEAIELDGQLESAPTINDKVFTGAVQISGQFTSSQASALATELRYGSLPVRFTFGDINTVSATLGHASLKAGLLAGLGGIVLVLLYMILYYRALGLVVVLGLAVGGALLYSILTELSYTSSLALTLSGITGVIVSIGITVDSYVVYFERLKDEVRQGKTVRSSVERGFARAFKTVLTADLVSFMAALILYLFTVGDVKGFAFTLGLSTILDVFTAYFFIRPIVVLLGRRRTTSETRFLGISRGLGAARPEGLR